MRLVVRFTDQSPSFTRGYECGVISAKMQNGIEKVDNNGFPVHTENVEVIKSICEYYGYIPELRKARCLNDKDEELTNEKGEVVDFSDWTNFSATKIMFSNN